LSLSFQAKREKKDKAEGAKIKEKKRHEGTESAKETGEKSGL